MFMPFTVTAQVITIDAARQLPVGTVVTVQGVVVNGQELGNIRYLTDGTAGIAAFGTTVSGIQPGDFIEVTGTLYSYFNLLELSPVSSFTVISQGNPLPAPLVVTPNQLGEWAEGQLVQINAALFQTGGVFSGSANYNITAAGEPGVVRINPNVNLVGTAIPTGTVTITAVCSQYQSTYQLLPRSTSDIQNVSGFYVTEAPRANGITTSGFQVNWQTNLAGNAFALYGKTPAYELGLLSGSSSNVAASVWVTGALPSEVYYLKPFSVNGNDTAYAASRVYITKSNSSGDVKTYFNRTVNNSVASPSTNLAIRLNNSFSDTIAAYIDRCDLTLDIAIYNFSAAGTIAIVNAINAAYQRGVTIRIISDGNNSNSALASLNAAIPVLNSPQYNGYFNIMHNKFMVLDALGPDANKAIVLAGSTNWTDLQLNTDANHLVFIRDQSLAKVYTMEFEEMWGGNGPQPNATASKFGPDKVDNTPHQLNIGGYDVECYFSPSDDVNNQIMRAINTSDSELYFALLVFTRFDLAAAIADRISHHGVYAAGIADDWNNGGQTAFGILQNVMGPRVMTYDHLSLPGILHHKYLIVDQADLASNPLVLTGSHNWSTTANQKNDENTLVVYHPATANQFYQEFWQRFEDNGGGTLSATILSGDNPVTLFPNPAQDQIRFSMISAAEILFFDLKGRKIYSGNLNPGNNTLDISDFRPGCYFIQLITPDKTLNKKLIISR
jgi:phosphatidylserine/phosphatidylglycerophosphate/cardiolipin synthase-like enzyme